MEKHVSTINDVFYAVVERTLDQVLLYKTKDVWTPMSSAELYGNVLNTARALTKFGIAPGDRVAILSENRPEWAIADFATMLLGAADVPIYPTLTAEQTAYVLRDSGAKVIFVSSHDQLRKVLAVKSTTMLERVVVMDAVETPDAVHMSQLTNGPSGRDHEFDQRAKSITPDTTATIIYTSGTTGTPKGAILTQGNLASNVMHSLDGFRTLKGHTTISFLPLSHITARHVDYALYWEGVCIAYCPFLDELLGALREVKPSVFVGVPRVYEKIHGQALSKIGVSGMKRRIYDWAIGVGARHRDQVYAGKTPVSPTWRLANALVFSKVKQALGGNAQVFISGGAPLSREIQDWYAAIGIRIFEGYGLTETSPVIGVNNPTAFRAGSVGKPLSNLDVKIASDGEILVKGPSVFKGYWNMPVETENAFEDGYFKTGDVGHLDSDGFLYVTDRKKDLIKTSGGKFIAPQPIEGKLKGYEVIAEAAIIGDRRKFPMIIVAPNFANLENWAREHNVAFSSREELVTKPQVRALYHGIIEELNANLAQFEKLKKLLIVPDEFTIANGFLTPTLKLKRRVVEERYRKQIEELYATAGSPEVATA
jgi:long-chain acyl-CoA synthetase